MSSCRPGSGGETVELNLGELLKQNPELQIGRDEYNINVTSNNGTLLTASETEEALRRHDGSAKPAHLYYHVPLCNYICHYCNYVKRLLSKEDQTRELLLWGRLLVEESSRYLNRFAWLSAARVESLYIGGGTASLLLNCEDAIRQVAEHSRACYDLSSGCEWNLEGNPDNFGKQQVQLAVDLGFNRFSVGIQSLQDEVNDFTGRRHTAQQSLEAIGRLMDTGFPLNVDMMFGLPYQTVDSVRQDMRTLCGMCVPTITIYRLRNVDREEMGIGNRAVWNLPKVRQRLVARELFPSLEETYEMRQAVTEVLLDNDYYPSPCGWWSAPRTYSDGNIPQVSRNKWQNYDTMIAYGPGAYGWLTGGKRDVVQTHNRTDIREYATCMESSDGLPLAFGRHLTGHGAIAATLGFNFKANQPIVLSRYQTQFGVDLLRDEPFASVFFELQERRLVEMVEEARALKPTLDGEALHEEIIEVYFHKKIGLAGAPLCRR